MDNTNSNRPTSDQAKESPPPGPPPVEGAPVPLPPYAGYQPQSPGYAPAPPYPAQPQLKQAAPASAPRYLMPIGIGLLVLFLMSAGLLVGGEPARFVNVGLQFVPFALLAALAYGGVKNGVAAVFSYLWLAMLALLTLFVDFALVLAAFIRGGPGSVQPGSDPSAVFKPGLGPALLWASLLLFLVAVVSGLLLLRPVRVLLSRIIPIDPDNFVHKIALPIFSVITLGSFVPLIVLGGKPPFLELVESGALNTAGGESVSVGPLDLVYQFVWTIPAAFVAAGWPIARTFKASLIRLGMVRPTLLQVAFGVVAGVVLAAVAAFVIDPGLTWLWRAMGWEPTNVEAFNQLIGNLITPIGAVLIGVTAGIGEEMAVRGLLQPRIGLVASNLLFTSLHAYQYGVDALLSVFIIGLMLGIIRARTNTSTSAVVHGVYNFVLVMASVLAAGQ